MRTIEHALRNIKKKGSRVGGDGSTREKKTKKKGRLRENKCRGSRGINIAA